MTSPNPTPPGRSRRAPIRTCIGCRTAQAPTAMVRVSMQEGRLSTDPTAGGRGAWVCPTTECVQLAIKRRAFPRALKTEVPSEALEELRAAIVTGPAFPRGARS